MGTTAIPSARAAYRRRVELLRSAPAAVWLVSGAAALYGAVYALGGAAVYQGVQDRRYDLGNMAQAVWSTAHGHFLAVSDDAGRQTTRLSAHVEPFLALFAPLWRIWPSPLMLLVAQALAVATGAVPVFLLARKHLGEARAGVAFAFVYLLYPATQFNAFAIANGFHPVSFATPLIVWAVWFVDEDRTLLFVLCAVLAAATKEEMPLAVGLLGLWIAKAKKRWQLGITTFALGAAATVVDFFVVIPHFAPPGTSPFVERYADVGRTPSGILHTAVTSPQTILGAVATPHKLVYLLLLLVPLLGLWSRAPLMFLGAVPDLVINLLSSRSDQTSVHFQYTAGIAPFVIAATVLGTARLRQNRSRAVALVLGAAVLMGVYSPAWYFANSRLGDKRPTAALRAAKRSALDRVPPTAAVAATNELAAYLSARRTVALFPHVQRADWVVVDSQDHSMGSPRALRRALAAVDSDRRWQLVYSAEGIQVLRRRVPQGDSARASNRGLTLSVR